MAVHGDALGTFQLRARDSPGHSVPQRRASSKHPKTSACIRPCTFLPKYKSPRFLEPSKEEGEEEEAFTNKIIPIAPTTVGCQACNYCRQTQVPLRLAFAWTIHTLQGISVGPVRDDQEEPNKIQRIVCDPGTRSFEGTNPGLFYTLCSRPTILGAENDVSTSALFLTGREANNQRIQNLFLDCKNKPYKKVTFREKWLDTPSTKKLAQTKV